MRCYSHLSDDEREQIGLAEALGHSIGAIAQAIGRPKSTVWRELCRNRLPSGRYSPLHAARAYQLRRRREARIERDRALRTFVVDRLARRVDPGANFRLAQGLFDRAGVKRPANFDFDINNKKAKAGGYCVISDTSGDQAYSSWQNEGDGVTGPGTFHYTGGTGK